ncbi:MULTISPECIES: LysR family transcriptional regulator [Pseudomonadota]|uniref:LysR family transcriptional regulator n=1 Tax=Pseudomonadota TaxID=1224 RepID=UPI00056E2F70|nr:MULTISPECIES: LysR substrate-binding domain-containing protein [Pseudomonadota]MBI2749019.1 LysR family transcriptional regulator [Burkholderiales bacterium]
MHLRQIRAFITVAEELHFGRAAKRLHIEQSPLSRTIRRLESDLGVTLLHRPPRGVHLTLAGQLFLEDARRILLAVEQAQARAKAVAVGYHCTLRVGLSGDIGQTRLSTLLALCREEAPQVKIQLSEMPLTQLVHGLGATLFDAGFAMLDQAEAGIVSAPVWNDPFVVALPARHPLLAFKEVPLEEAVSYPLVLCDPQACQGCSLQRERLFRTVDAQPAMVEYVATHGLMLAFVAAGYGVGLSTAAHLAACQQPDVVSRPLAGQTAVLTTFVLRAEGDVTEPLRHFINRAERVGRQDTGDLRRI